MAVARRQTNPARRTCRALHSGVCEGRLFPKMLYFADCGSSPAAFQRSAEPALASIFTKAAAGSPALAVVAAS